jgi:hypothetical protein
MLSVPVTYTKDFPLGDPDYQVIRTTPTPIYFRLQKEYSN